MIKPPSNLYAAAIASALIFLNVGCRSHRDVNSEIAGVKGAEKPSAVITKAPLLTTNEVSRLAFEAARRGGFKLDAYVCDSIVFPDATHPDKWLVLFSRSPNVPDDYLFVSIDDNTGKAEIWRP